MRDAQESSTASRMLKIEEECIVETGEVCCLSADLFALLACSLL